MDCIRLFENSSISAKEKIALDYIIQCSGAFVEKAVIASPHTCDFILETEILERFEFDKMRIECDGLSDASVWVFLKTFNALAVIGTVTKGGGAEDCLRPPFVCQRFRNSWFHLQSRPRLHRNLQPCSPHRAWRELWDDLHFAKGINPPFQQTSFASYRRKSSATVRTSSGTE